MSWALRITFVCCLRLAAVAAMPALAQEGPTTLEFSFSNPGARSLGFGGAFVALADDATAAFANPAGLVQLARPEVSAEGRLWSYKTPFIAGGRLGGEPTGLGLDTSSEVVRAESTEDLPDLSFLSFVYPRKRWALAFYRHQLAKFESSSQIEGLFGDPTEPPFVLRLNDIRSSFRFDAVGHGVAAAWRVTDTLSLGGGLSHFDGRVTSVSERYRPPDAFGPGSFVPESVITRNLGNGESTDWALNAGILWRLSERWTVGGSYREGPDFSITVAERAGQANDVGVPDGTLLGSFEGVPFNFPDVYGLGVAYRSTSGAWTVSFAWNRVEYSELIEGLGSADTNLVDVDGIAIDDGDELRLGFEIALLSSTPTIALRFGGWLDPDHRVRSSVDANPFSRAVFAGGDDELHLAVGLGLVLETLQIDVALDFSELVDTASLSAIYSF